MAGILSLINDARLNKNLGPLGFINDTLYTLMKSQSVYEECFNDVYYSTIGELWDVSS